VILRIGIPGEEADSKKLEHKPLDRSTIFDELVWKRRAEIQGTCSFAEFVMACHPKRKKPG